MFRKKKVKTHYEEGWDSYSETWEAQQKKNGINKLGDEWGTEELTTEIINNFVVPYIPPRPDILEIGCGGGKFSARLAPLAGKLICTDVSSKMLERTQKRLEEMPNIEFEKLNGYDLHQFKNNQFDFVLSFDTFVHIDMEDAYSYIKEIKRVLRPKGKGLLHFANILSPEGWQKFVTEVPFYRGDHKYYNRFRFLTWEIVERFLSSLGFVILSYKKEPWRDILVVFGNEQDAIKGS